MKLTITGITGEIRKYRLEVTFSCLFQADRDKLYNVLFVFLLLFLQTAFFRQHGASTNDANAKYHSRAASLYKDKIKGQAAAAMRKYGTEVMMSFNTNFKRPGNFKDV